MHTYLLIACTQVVAGKTSSICLLILFIGVVTPRYLVFSTSTSSIHSFSFSHKFPSIFQIIQKKNWELSRRRPHSHIVNGRGPPKCKLHTLQMAQAPQRQKPPRNDYHYTVWRASAVPNVHGLSADAPRKDFHNIMYRAYMWGCLPIYNFLGGLFFIAVLWGRIFFGGVF